jgi:hypothetical protein
LGARARARLARSKLRSLRGDTLLSLRERLDVDREAAGLALVVLQPRGGEQRFLFLEVSQVLHTPDHAGGRAGRRAIPARANASSAQLALGPQPSGKKLRTYWWEPK